MHKAVLLSILLCAACSKKEENKGGTATTTTPTGSSPAGSAPGTTPPTSAPAAPASGAPRMVEANCDKIVSPELRDKYFKDATFTDTPAPGAYSAKCKIEGPVTPEMKVAPNTKTWNGHVTVTCHENMPAGVLDGMMKRELEVADTKKVEVGKGAGTMLAGNSGSLTNAFAYDDDSDCKVQLTLPTPLYKDDLLKDMIAALPIK